MRATARFSCLFTRLLAKALMNRRFDL